MIKEVPDEMSNGEFKPRHIIEIYCPNPDCQRDVDEAELAARKCSECGESLDAASQHVTIVVANMSFGGGTLR
jgi:hypothetical protein